MAAKGSLVAGQLLRALALRMRQQHVCPLTPLHIAGKKNELTDVPSRSFGSEKKWHCKNDAELLTLFNSLFPLPQQQSWTVFHPSFDISMRVISLLRMQVSGMEEWRRLPRRGRFIGAIGRPTSNLWEWTLTYRESATPSGSGCSQDSQHGFGTAGTAQGELSRVIQYQRRSRPLVRRLPWCAV